MTYKEDMAKTLEVMARRQGLSTTYDDTSASATGKRSQKQSTATSERREGDVMKMMEMMQMDLQTQEEVSRNTKKT